MYVIVAEFKVKADQIEEFARLIDRQACPGLGPITAFMLATRREHIPTRSDPGSRLKRR